MEMPAWVVVARLWTRIARRETPIGRVGDLVISASYPMTKWIHSSDPRLVLNQNVKHRPDFHHLRFCIVGSLGRLLGRAISNGVERVYYKV